VLEIRDMVCGYGNVTALRGISLQVKAGQLVALIGANGAGKSTTLRAISGLVAPRSGSMLFEGKDIAGAKPPRVVAAGIAHCPEGRRVVPHMTVEENLDMGAYLRTKSTEISADRDRIYAEFPRLAERRKQAAGTLSGGEQQMLAIGRALMSRPRLIMFDEPSLGLAPNIVERTFAIIRGIRDAGTVLLVEQNALRRSDVRSRHLLEGAYRSVRPTRDDRERARAKGLSWRMSGTKRRRCQATGNGCRSAGSAG
jgi:branched-chain amino acid transport system ATP-binding protein